MYHPYFRGKQYELVAIRENANRMVAGIVPIIEPVKSSLSGLRRTIQALIDNGIRFVLIANPRHGDLVEDPSSIRDEITGGQIGSYSNWSLGYIADDDSSRDEMLAISGIHDHVSVVHHGHADSTSLAEELGSLEGVKAHIFVEDKCSKLYRRKFIGVPRVLLRDGFDRMTNRDYPPVEHFSDLHITYEDESVNGFGDYLIVGDDYMETGGPAYAVAIHLTYVDHDQEDDMFIKHYKSDRTTSPTDPAGKFAEALQKMISEIDEGGSPLLVTDAVEEYRQLNADGHYPGLGYAKKLSMQHHIEVLADYIG